MICHHSSRMMILGTIINPSGMIDALIMLSFEREPKPVVFPGGGRVNVFETLWNIFMMGTPPSAFVTAVNCTSQRHKMHSNVYLATAKCEMLRHKPTQYST